MQSRYWSAVLSLTSILFTASPVSALTVTGPHYSDSVKGAGYTVIEGNTAPFDFMVSDYPAFPLQSPTDPNPGEPSAWLDVTVDYGDGSAIFSESYPAISNPHAFHIKDRTWSLPAHPAFDDASGFIFNEFPYYRQYPQGHSYQTVGTYNLSVHVEVRSELTTLDVSAFAPLQIDVPVQVISASDAPELALEYTEYDPATDELTIELTYDGPQDLQFTIDNSVGLREEFERNLKVEISRIGSAFSLFASSFTDWELIQSVQNQSVTRPYHNEYKLVVQDASTVLGLDPATEAFWVKLEFGHDNIVGLLGNWFVLDSVSENNFQQFEAGAPLKMNIDLSSDATVRAGRTFRQNGVLNNINPASTLVNYTIQWGDGSPVTQSSFVPTGTTKNFTLNHTYQVRGTYSLSLCANDGFRETCDQMKVTVN